MRLSVRHVTRYDYDPPAHRASLRLKLFPPRFEGQSPSNWAVSINGEPVSALFVNGMGEGEAIWAARDSVDAIEIVAEGVVDTVEKSGVVRGLADASRPPMFLRETPLTAPNPAIRKLAGAAIGDDRLSSLHKLCGAVRDAVDYIPNATAAHTTAAEALKLKRGVCQDHAHVFIAAARAIGVPARYVTGYLQTEAAQQTHAWAEAFTDLGWVGFDPANRQCPTDAYIRLCAGFDAADAAPVRGTVSAGISEGLSVAVEIAQAQQ